MENFQAPERFSIMKPVEWPDWKQRFACFRIATKLNKGDEAVQPVPPSDDFTTQHDPVLPTSSRPAVSNGSNNPNTLMRTSSVRFVRKTRQIQ
ncbi:hypothetical protein CHS0354_004560 [Potamilus streckersoni]|uniref:Uncharacterized protein n=1 Tax=Potamilus streckersoni TaxID=2493646 RepID=A0AAE0S666_9BIVA|nr:hypothetical protein CHS0354_004560 [Potamilus streckersoni]